MDKVFSGTIEDKRLKLEDPDGFKDRIKSFKDGSKVSLVLKKHKKQRSNNQNRYYWGVVLPIISEYVGYRSDEVEMLHDNLRYKFLRESDLEKFGLPRIGSTKKLNTEKFEKYLSNIRIWATSELGIKIPLPNEVEEQ